LWSNISSPRLSKLLPRFSYLNLSRDWPFSSYFFFILSMVLFFTSTICNKSCAVYTPPASISLAICRWCGICIFNIRFISIHSSQFSIHSSQTWNSCISWSRRWWGWRSPQKRVWQMHVILTVLSATQAEPRTKCEWMILGLRWWL